jgi:hypothetical protein
MKLYKIAFPQMLKNNEFPQSGIFRYTRNANDTMYKCIIIAILIKIKR